MYRFFSFAGDGPLREEPVCGMKKNEKKRLYKHVVMWRQQLPCFTSTKAEWSFMNYSAKTPSNSFLSEMFHKVHRYLLAVAVDYEGIEEKNITFRHQ
ncbi:CLUMA_CG007715, isoform A [Clunio marinus]|uniref:CLUMA_CG007715, isoform A n=1 Tax=Clunio marinus TaxID=568069 RepID=A0A1J1I1I1_9DIPT|nr:CLUMA_CG007715, isoform A [Clunio marinus]